MGPVLTLLDMIFNLTVVLELLVTFGGDIIDLIHSMLGLEAIEAVDLIELENTIFE